MIDVVGRTLTTKSGTRTVLVTRELNQRRGERAFVVRDVRTGRVDVISLSRLIRRFNLHT